MMGFRSHGNSTFQQLDAPDRVHLDQLTLLAREGAGLAEDLVRHAHLPHVVEVGAEQDGGLVLFGDRKSTRLNSSHGYISYAVFCLKKKKKTIADTINKRYVARERLTPAAR